MVDESRQGGPGDAGDIVSGAVSDMDQKNAALHIRDLEAVERGTSTDGLRAGNEPDTNLSQRAYDRYCESQREAQQFYLDDFYEFVEDAGFAGGNIEYRELIDFLDGQMKMDSLRAKWLLHLQNRYEISRNEKRERWVYRSMLTEDSMQEDPKLNYIPATVVREAQQVVDAVNYFQSGGDNSLPVTGVWASTYRDQDFLDYIVFHDAEDAVRFGEIMRKLNPMPDDMQERSALFDEWVRLAGINVLHDHLNPIYVEGEWKVTPEQLIQNEEDMRVWADDRDWHDWQREHLAGK